MEIEEQGGAPILAAAFKNEGWKVAGPQEVVLQVLNPIQYNRIKTQAGAIQKSLQKAVAIPNLSFSVVLAQSNEEGPKRIYTDQDRLNMLLEKYPAFQTLQKNLGLDLES